jgi:hypothetical protein
MFCPKAGVPVHPGSAGPKTRAAIEPVGRNPPPKTYASSEEPIGAVAAGRKIEVDEVAIPTVTGSSAHPLVAGSFAASPEYVAVQCHVPRRSSGGGKPASQL